MFLHSHPYKPIVFQEATRWIVGTLPPPRFTTGELKPGDVDFCYGSRDGMLWPILDKIFDLGLLYENNARAILQRMKFLKEHRIGICDIVASARRNKVDASDLGMQEVVLRDLIGYLRKYPRVHTLLFTGGNSKNGPEYFFRRLLRNHGLKLRPVSADIPRIHEFDLTAEDTAPRTIRTVSLTAPSGSANRAVGSMKEYQLMKAENPDLSTLDFRVRQYRRHFVKT